MPIYYRNNFSRNDRKSWTDVYHDVPFNIVVIRSEPEWKNFKSLIKPVFSIIPTLHHWICANKKSKYTIFHLTWSTKNAPTLVGFEQNFIWNPPLALLFELCIVLQQNTVHFLSDKRCWNPQQKCCDDATTPASRSAEAKHRQCQTISISPYTMAAAATSAVAKVAQEIYPKMCINYGSCFPMIQVSVL